MSTLETINGLLHDDKYAVSRDKLVNVIVIFIVCGAWSGAGYILGNRDKDARFERLQSQHIAQLAAESDKFRQELDNLRLTCTKKEVGK